MKYKISTCFIPLSLAYPIQAQDITPIHLGQSIVSASRIDTPIDQAPGNVSIITQRDVKMRPNAKFSDTIRGVEGLQQSKSRGFDTFDSVRIRGLSGAAIMVDGIILNDINNNTKMLASMSSSDIAQVEVVRGAFSNVYGSGAVAGAINFITSMPTTFESKAELGYGNALNSAFAPKHTFRGFASIGDVFFDKKLRAKFSFGTTSTQGYAADSVIVRDVSGYNGAKPTLDSNTAGNRFNIGDMGRQAYSTYDSTLRAEYDITDESVLSGYIRWNMYEYEHKDQKTFLTQNGMPSYGNNADINSGKPAPILYGRYIGKEMYNQLISSVGYKHYLPNDDYFELKVYRIDGWDTFNNPDGGASPTTANTTIYGGSGTQSNHKYEIHNIDMIYTHAFNEHHQILAGLQYRHNNYKQTQHYIANYKFFRSQNTGSPTSNYTQGGKTSSIGIFAEWQSDWESLISGLSSNIGLRGDSWQGYGIYRDKDTYSKNTKNVLSPKVSLNYALSAYARLKSSFGQAFKAPNFSQLFSNRTYTDGTPIKGNPNLKPENVLSFDIGFEYDLSPLFGIKKERERMGALKVYYFNNTTTNAIMQYSTSAPEHLRGLFDNLGKNRIQGLESSLLLPLGYGLSIYLTYTFMDSKILKSLERSTEGNRVAGVPMHLGYGGIFYENMKVYGSFGIEYASKPFKNSNNTPTPSNVYGATDSYSIADVKLGLKLSKHLNVNGSITNLFNQTYYSYYRASGRAFFVALEGKF